MSIVKVDLKQFTKDLLPMVLRTEKRIDYLYALLNNIYTRYSEMLIRREDNLFISQHTGQIASLEHLLNSKVNVLGKPIYIDDNYSVPLFYIGKDNTVLTDIKDIYSRNDGDVEYNPIKPYIGNDGVNAGDNQVWLQTDSIVNNDYIDFIVYVDYVDYQDASKLKLIEYYVNKYRTMSFTFIITPY